MISFNKFINEKLKLNSNEKLDIAQMICNYWGLENHENIKEIKKIIDKWVIDNNVIYVIPATIKYTFQDISKHIQNEYLKDYEVYDMPYEIPKKYNNKDLFKMKRLYDYHKAGESSINILGNKYAIALCSWFGEIYCIKDN